MTDEKKPRSVVAYVCAGVFLQRPDGWRIADTPNALAGQTIRVRITEEPEPPKRYSVREELAAYRNRRWRIMDAKNPMMLVDDFAADLYAVNGCTRKMADDLCDILNAKEQGHE